MNCAMMDDPRQCLETTSFDAPACYTPNMQEKRQRWQNELNSKSAKNEPGKAAKEEKRKAKENADADGKGGKEEEKEKRKAGNAEGESEGSAEDDPQSHEEENKNTNPAQMMELATIGLAAGIFLWMFYD